MSCISSFKTESNTNSSSCNQPLVDYTGLGTPSDVTAVIKDNPYWMQMYIPET